MFVDAEYSCMSGQEPAMATTKLTRFARSPPLRRIFCRPRTQQKLLGKSPRQLLHVEGGRTIIVSFLGVKFRIILPECGEFGADTTWGSVGENQVRQSVGGDDVRSVRIFRCFPRVFDSLYPGFTESTRGTLKNCMTKDLPNQSHSTGRFFRHDAHDSFFRKIS